MSTASDGLRPLVDRLVAATLASDAAEVAWRQLRCQAALIALGGTDRERRDAIADAAASGPDGGRAFAEAWLADGAEDERAGRAVRLASHQLESAVHTAAEILLLGVTRLDGRDPPRPDVLAARLDPAVVVTVALGMLVVAADRGREGRTS